MSNSLSGVMPVLLVWLAPVFLQDMTTYAQMHIHIFDQSHGCTDRFLEAGCSKISLTISTKFCEAAANSGKTPSCVGTSSAAQHYQDRKHQCQDKQAVEAICREQKYIASERAATKPRDDIAYLEVQAIV